MFYLIIFFITKEGHDVISRVIKALECFSSLLKYLFVLNWQVVVFFLTLCCLIIIPF